MDSMEFEEKRLKQTLEKLENIRVSLQKIPRYFGKDIVEQLLDDQRQQQLKNMEIAQVEPYFGRLDFEEAGNKPITPLYIGKAGIQDENTNELIVIDWRAPVSSMFYSFTGSDDPISYESPDGEVWGKIHLKRNIAIRNQVLQRVVDSYVRGVENLGVTDEFLLYRLSDSKDSRLRDIVSTIQQEQDLIIRADYDRVLLIQGVAGSGKTTVALHRLAYLLYQYQNKINPQKIIIFAPNHMFLDYISEVLPELGVGEIQQTTFEEWALTILKENITLKDRHHELVEWFDPDMDHQTINPKGRYLFLQEIEDELKRYETNFFPDKGFAAWDNKFLSAEEIGHWFYEEYKHYPLMKRKERVMARIKRWIEMEHKEIRERDPKGLKKKQANKLFTAYKKTWPNHSVLEWYRLFIQKSKLLTGKLQEKGKKREVAYEDLAPLVYIHDRLYGIEGDQKYDHIVIDEAQDFSPVQVAVLQKHCPSNSFTILGDILQNIYSFQGIGQWDDFSTLFDSQKLRFHQLERSYRSTMEIIHFANGVLGQYAGDVKQAEPVFRSGQAVQIVQVVKEKRMDWIKETIEKLERDQVKTIALVTRDEETCSIIHEALQNIGVSANRITFDQKEYLGGISIAPVYLTKGMEFDAVILLDVDKEQYLDDALHAKLLYVGCTRALHQLILTYSKSMSSLVERVSPELYQAKAYVT
ncbi:AAA family ATPase [Shimazuella sp. AN120528]|uniref:HelD family protein n=1 Tax=Shimazuella soli TaxID=1892854 RepID=UPI001F0FD48A|nr:UvrD-helicase domain-containing protein [Shimazuella soli]MCH5584606.1 AAA family ATPase [Shimazuella soli]